MLTITSKTLTRVNSYFQGHSHVNNYFQDTHVNSYFQGHIRVNTYSQGCNWQTLQLQLWMYPAVLRVVTITLIGWITSTKLQHIAYQRKQFQTELQFTECSTYKNLSVCDKSLYSSASTSTLCRNCQLTDTLCICYKGNI